MTVKAPEAKTERPCLSRPFRAFSFAAKPFQNSGFETAARVF
jgi:hypothetical protein